MTSPCTLSRHAVSPSNGTACPICLISLERGNVVAHSVGGERHPLHATCLAQWLRTQSNCPVCRAVIDRDSLQLSLKDKVIERLSRRESQLLVTIFAVFVGTMFLFHSYNSVFSKVPYFDSTISRTCVLFFASFAGGMLVSLTIKKLYPEFQAD